MKRIFLIIAIIVSLMVAGPVLAAESETETGGFDHEQLFSQFENYKYDRFDKTWKCFDAALKVYSDANVVVGIELDGDDEKIDVSPIIYAFIEDTTSSNVDTNGDRIFLHEITKVQLLIDDVLYTFEPVFCSSSEAFIYIYEEYREIIDALADANSVVMKLSWDGGSVETEFTADEFATLKEFAGYLRDINVWQYCVDSEEGFKEKYLEYYPMTVTK